MFRIKNEDVIYFNNDDEFYKFCVNPQIKAVKYINPKGEEDYFTDFDFTQNYKDAIEQGKKFIIKDEDSRIFKNGMVSYRTISKKVDNLEQYFKM